jgi:DHA1 family multidrug resistance protein-like MFS transporter
LIDTAGYVIAQVLFRLPLCPLYLAGILEGVLSPATLSYSAGYVVDMTTEKDRAHGMAWLCTAVSFGIIAGPELEGMLPRRDFASQLALWALHG